MLAQAPPTSHPGRRTPGGDFHHSKLSALSRVGRMRLWAVALLWLSVNLAFWGWWLHRTTHSNP